MEKDNFKEFNFFRQTTRIGQCSSTPIRSEESMFVNYTRIMARCPSQPNIASPGTPPVCFDHQNRQQFVMVNSDSESESEFKPNKSRAQKKSRNKLGSAKKIRMSPKENNNLPTRKNNVSIKLQGEEQKKAEKPNKKLTGNIKGKSDSNTNIPKLKQSSRKRKDDLVKLSENKTVSKTSKIPRIVKQKGSKELTKNKNNDSHNSSVNSLDNSRKLFSFTQEKELIDSLDMTSEPEELVTQIDKFEEIEPAKFQSTPKVQKSIKSWLSKSIDNKTLQLNSRKSDSVSNSQSNNVKETVKVPKSKEVIASDNNTRVEEVMEEKCKEEKQNTSSVSLKNPITENVKCDSENNNVETEKIIIRQSGRKKRTCTKKGLSGDDKNCSIKTSETVKQNKEEEEIASSLNITKKTRKGRKNEKSTAESNAVENKSAIVDAGEKTKPNSRHCSNLEVFNNSKNSSQVQSKVRQSSRKAKILKEVNDNVSKQIKIIETNESLHAESCNNLEVETKQLTNTNQSTHLSENDQEKNVQKKEEPKTRSENCDEGCSKTQKDLKQSEKTRKKGQTGGKTRKTKLKVTESENLQMKKESAKLIQKELDVEDLKIIGNNHELTDKGGGSSVADNVTKIKNYNVIETENQPVDKDNTKTIQIDAENEKVISKNSTDNKSTEQEEERRTAKGCTKRMKRNVDQNRPTDRGKMKKRRIDAADDDDLQKPPTSPKASFRNLQFKNSDQGFSTAVWSNSPFAKCGVLKLNPEAAASGKTNENFMGFISQGKVMFQCNDLEIEFGQYQSFFLPPNMRWKITNISDDESVITYATTKCEKA